MVKLDSSRGESPMSMVRKQVTLISLAVVLGCAAPTSKAPPQEIWTVATCIRDALMSSRSATNVLIEEVDDFPIVVFDYTNAGGLISHERLELGLDLDDEGMIQSRYLFLNSLETPDDWFRIGDLVEGACNASQVLVPHPHKVSIKLKTRAFA